MKKLTVAEQSHYQEILKTYKDRLLDYDGVSNVAIGYPMKDGKLDREQIAILVFVVKKFPEAELMEKQLLPKSLAGLPVDVIQSDPKEHAEELRNPLFGGIGISNANLSGRGTLGIIVAAKEGGDLLGLTNWHVIKNRRGHSDDPIVQPAWNPNNDKYRIGNLLKWDKELDCAVFTVNQLRTSEAGRLLDVSGTVTTMTVPLVGLEVVKSGARTGVTFGVISAVDENNIDVRVSPNEAKPSPDNEISRPGDSGAVWVTDEANPSAVALHWGGDGEDSPASEYALARNIEPIAEALAFDFRIPAATT